MIIRDDWLFAMAEIVGDGDDKDEDGYRWWSRVVDDISQHKYYNTKILFKTLTIKKYSNVKKIKVN